jgi:hemoglobin-like flavoprotein
MKVTIHPLSGAPSVPPGVAADAALIKRLQESFRALLDAHPSLADHFYARLFQGHPELRSMFPRDMANQKKKLLDTLNLIVENLQAPLTVRARLEKLGESHVAYGARPEHYPIVLSALVGAIAEMAGPNWTADLEDDWTSAISMVAAIMIEASGKKTR